MALATQAELERHLQVTFDNDPEAVVTQLIENAQATIESFCRRSFDYTAGIEETLDGGARPVLFLANYPVTAAPTVVEDGVALVAGTDFIWYPDGRLYRGDGTYEQRWTYKRQSVAVTYSAGYGGAAPAPYDEIPADLRWACLRIAGRAFQAAAAYANSPDEAISVVKVALDGSDSVEFSDESRDVSKAMMITDEERDLISNYRRVLIA